MTDAQVHKDFRKIHQRALALGWIERQRFDNRILMQHPSVNREVTIPTAGTRFDPNDVRRMGRRIEQAAIAPSNRQQNRTALGIQKNEPAEELYGALTVTLPNGPDVILAPMTPEQKELFSDSFGDVRQVSAEAKKSAPTIIRTKPAIAKKGMTPNGGRVYESEVGLERKWSDGTTDYICSAETCEFTSPSLRGMGSHYGQIHGTIDKNAVERRTFIDPDKTWEPSSHANGVITRLANEIAEALEAGLTDPQEIASAIVRKRHENSRFTEDTDTPDRVLSPDEQLAAIRRVLETGAETAARLQKEREQQAKVEELEARNLELANTNAKLSEEVAETSAKIAEVRAAHEILTETFSILANK